MLFYDDDDDDDELFDLASQKQRTFCGERDADRTRACREIVSKKTFGDWYRFLNFFFFVSSRLFFFVFSSERFRKGTFTLSKRCFKLLGETRGKNARHSDTLTYLRRTQSVWWRTCFALNRLRRVDRD